MDNYSNINSNGLGNYLQKDGKRIFIAGKLNSSNVKSVVKKLKPFGIDVCSSIESYPGKKDFSKMQGFAGAVKNAA